LSCSRRHAVWQFVATASPENAMGVSSVARQIPADPVVSKILRDDSDDGDTLTGMVPLLTERDVAIRLRVTLNDLNALLENGDLSYSVIGGELRIADDDIRDFVGRMRTQSTLPRRSDNECKL